MKFTSKPMAPCGVLFPAAMVPEGQFFKGKLDNRKPSLYLRNHRSIIDLQNPHDYVTAGSAVMISDYEPVQVTIEVVGFVGGT